MEPKKNLIIDEFKRHYTPRLRILSPWFSQRRYFSLSYQLAFVILVVFIISCLAAVKVGVHLSQESPMSMMTVPPMPLIPQAPLFSTAQLDSVTQQMGRIEANLMRINALGDQLVRLAHLDPAEFDFGHEVALGGPEEILNHLTVLEAHLDKRYNQLLTLHQVIQKATRQYELSFTGSAKVVANGWISSFFGNRYDPFTGHKAWHGGIDIVGREGSEINAIASGIVSFAGEKGGYGNFLEIDHGDGFATRYGHNKKLLVNEGQLVRKGQPIALLGSTGRSTGPHLHLEVHKNGKAVDPGDYFDNLKRKS